jgi:mannose-1-phosphate guanylyltransferase
MKFIVTAGGQGTKLWPLSRNSTPKQFQPIVGSESVFAQNVKTLLKQHSPSDIFISTKRKYVKHVLEQAPQISIKNLIVEPDHEKNRGPGEGLAFLKLSIIAPNEPFMLIQADDLRIYEKDFLQFIKDCEAVFKKELKFITGGEKATLPEMGADYIKLGDKIKSNTQVEFYDCAEFIPRLNDYKKTEQLVSSFHVVTHVNHLTCYPEMILGAYKQHKPDWYEALMKIKEFMDTPDEEEKTNEIYAQMEAGPTELVTQHLFTEDKFVIALANFDWVDFGTWDNVKSYTELYGNKRKKNVLIDSEGSYARAQDGKLVVIYGVKNVIVADTPDALLVIDKDQTAKISDIVKELRKKDFDTFL